MASRSTNKKNRLTPLEQKIIQDKYEKVRYCRACGQRIEFFGRSADDVDTGWDVYQWELHYEIHRSCARRKEMEAAFRDHQTNA